MVDRLEMFIALANERHFGRAAEVCGVTQPTLSSAIRQLEDHLGVQLVLRGSRFQGLTPEGHRTLDWARRIVADSRALRDEMRAARQGLSGQLRLGVIPTALAMAARLTAPFLERHPGVRLSILSRSSSEIVTRIEALELDAGLTYLDGEPLGRLEALPLYHEGYALLVGADSAIAGRGTLDWADLAGEPLCLLTSDMQNRRIVDRHLSEAFAAAAHEAPPPRLESNSIVALAAHVAAGGWSSVLPARMAALFARDPRLAAVPIAGERHAVGLVVPRRAPHTPLIAALLDTARRVTEA
ncbi:LysR family transcriptional regulator [Rhodobaculum claviforme]|uniref:LysR family transcriptional regulator n=1 Tax=Rhodobaculum claviforme TaxID=1549854 RepID=A0A934WII0_9RHOB|nr:LysR family transcriptional regulator [Rhodobaculum claviforme]MBK5928230.1 LysR family transcriptional regulator [Rhodobaculum claviforme]